MILMKAEYMDLILKSTRKPVVKLISIELCILALVKAGSESVLKISVVSAFMSLYLLSQPVI